MRKAQVTLFIILGTLVLLVAGLLLYASRVAEPPTEDVARLPAQAQTVYQEVNHCIQTLSEDYLMLMGMEGGYLLLDIQPTRLTFPLRDWLTDGKADIPTIERLEQDLAAILEDTIDYCATNVTHPNLQSLTPSGDRHVSVTFRDNDVLVRVNYPLRATFTGEAESAFALHTFTLPVRMRHILDIAADITRANAASPDTFSPDAFTTYDVDVTIRPGTTYWIYSLIDYNSDLRGQPYQFTFGQHYGEKP